MGLIEDELEEVQKLYKNGTPGARLITCLKAMVRVEIKKTEVKCITICIQFPEGYPRNALLLELKTKTLSEKLLNRLTEVCENESKKYLGKPQVVVVLKFVQTFMDQNPLCCCYDEVDALKKKVDDGDEIKLKQKTSSISLRVLNKKYFLNCRISVPDMYPTTGISFEEVSTNFSPSFERHMLGQAKEIIRRCVEPPLRKKANEIFIPRPSLKDATEFLLDCVKRIPSERCQFCEQLCFPSEPQELELNENFPKHIERIFCGHLFHQACLFKFMKMPPFGNKKCKTCGAKISHHKWSFSDSVAEERWAHGQAKERELQEVTDFFK